MNGKLRSALIIGGQGIRSRKLRTFLSMISLFLGVLAVVAVQAGSEIASRAMLVDIELSTAKDGTLSISLPTHESTVSTTMDLLHGRGDAVGMLTQQAIIGEPGVTPINPGGSPFEFAHQEGYVGGPMMCDNYGCRPMQRNDSPPPPGAAIELGMVGLTGDIRQFRPFRMEGGQWLDFAGEPSLSPGIVINREAAKGFSQHRIPAEMRIQGASANATPRIIGVVHDGASQPMAYARADELLTWLPKAGTTAGQYGPPLMVLAQPGARDFTDILRARLVAQGAPADQFSVWPIDIKKQMESELSLMRAIFLAMAALVLLIGVAGILNVGLATVGERVEEFALRRAVGTPRLLLAGIVLAETLIIGMLTAAAAIGAGVVGLEAAGRFGGRRFEMMAGVGFPWQAAVAGVIAGLVAGVLGGLLPAIRAARIPIATVMRA